jgi:chorismate dehydratase
MPDNLRYRVFLFFKGYHVRMSAVHNHCIRIGVVNFLNATPLIEGLGGVEGIELIPKVPSDLMACLERDEVDFALASSIDFQRSKDNIGILPVGVLSSDGDSLTVQLCSRIPFEDVTTVHCDSDSHTSVALLQIILKQKFEVVPEVISTDVRSLEKCNSNWPDTVLIIGDKVVSCDCQSEYEFTLDLGEAWKEQTGLPFVFAIWQGRLNCDKQIVNKVSILFNRQLLLNLQRIEHVVSTNALRREWEPSLALQYVTEHMHYHFTDAHQESLELFYALAHSLGIIEQPQPIQYISS